MNIKLNVYNEDFTDVKKECNANIIKIPFGMIRKLMGLFDVEHMDDTTQILNVVMNSWNDVVVLLSRIFPEIEDEEWDYVDTKELVSVLFKVLKESAKGLLRIPSDSKN